MEMSLVFLGLCKGRSKVYLVICKFQCEGVMENYFFFSSLNLVKCSGLNLKPTHFG